MTMWTETRIPPILSPSTRTWNLRVVASPSVRMTVSAEAVFHSFREAVTRFIRRASSNPDRARGTHRLGRGVP